MVMGIASVMISEDWAIGTVGFSMVLGDVMVFVGEVLFGERFDGKVWWDG